MTLAIAECVKLGVSEEYIRTFATEVENMIFTEWNWDDAKEVWREEAREEGMEEGMAKGMEKGRDEVFALLKKGLSVEEVEKMLRKRRTEGVLT
jgi:flagellar biosynthesis/type III secretory pathway protein FliH